MLANSKPVMIRSSIHPSGAKFKHVFIESDSNEINEINQGGAQSKTSTKYDVRFTIATPKQLDESGVLIKSDSDEADEDDFEDGMEPATMRGIFQNEVMSARVTSANPVSSQSRDQRNINFM